ncbi:MAG: DUF4375 domain-containing protein [Chloroflexi bacterium]|nr:DUF4375 domain-containing protein [Chloroflexota bacterium]
MAWNSFIDLIAMTPRESLSPAQQVAAFSFKYDAEVQNGGHLQFFENSSGKYVPETREALPQLGAHQQREVLLQAYKRRTSKPRKRIRTVEEYVETGLEQEFEDLDSAYYNCKPTITDLLEKWLDQNFDEFIEIVE